MSKMSKTIAILGVVAGLGVAALPLSTYATPVEWSSTPDTNTPAAWGTDGTNRWVKDSTTVKLTIDDTLSIEAVAAGDNADLADLGNGNAKPTVDVTVITNNSKGYNLGIQGTATTGTANALTSKTVTTDFIPAMTAPFDTPAALSDTASEWGYSVSTASTNATEASTTALAKFTGNVFAGVKTTNDIVLTTDAATVKEGEKTTFTFAAALKNGQAAGEYEGQVTFTATNNPNA